MTTPSDAFLQEHGSPREGHAIPIVSPVTTIGRHPGNILAINDKSVSRHHARIVVGRNGYRLEDLGSKNGTFVNGKRVEGSGSLLSPGDVIQMAGATASYVFRKWDTTITAVDVPRAANVRRLEVDHRAREVHIDEQPVAPLLAPKEFALLAFLDQHRGEAVGKEAIVEAVWPERHGDVGNHEIEACVHRLRARIEANPGRPAWLLTVRGYGYKLV